MGVFFCACLIVRGLRSGVSPRIREVQWRGVGVCAACVEAVADGPSVPTVGMFTRPPLLFKQPAAFSLATGAAAASPTATVEQEYGGRRRRRRSQEVRAAAQRPLSKTLASRSERVSGSKHLVCVSSVCEVYMRDCV